MFFKMEHCDVYYGQIQALYDINVEINPGEIISIIGANGAGKTTLMKSIMGLVPAKNGKIVWQDEEIQARKTTISSSAASAMSPRAVRSSRA